MQIDAESDILPQVGQIILVTYSGITICTCQLSSYENKIFIVIARNYLDFMIATIYIGKTCHEVIEDQLKYLRPGTS